MNCMNQNLTLLLACSAIAASALAQGFDESSTGRTLPGQPLQQSAPLVPIHTQAADDGVPYGIWAAGSAYKASFHDGATFVPYLGRDYPETRSLKWRTLSAQVGETELCDGAPPRLSYGAHRAEYDLGQVVEAYDVLPEGLEQTFVIEQRPAGHGDLVIRGAIETGLHADPLSPAHAGIPFHDDQGLPILSYGAATAIDARGRQREMTTAFDGDVLTLRLDAQWLASAAFPLVVDPMLGVIFTVTGTEIEQLDVLRDSYGTSGNNWRSATRWVSASDADLWCRRFDDDGTGGVVVFADLNTSWSTSETSLGQHRYAGCVVLAFTREFANGTRKLRFHKHLRSDLTLQANVVAVDTGSAQAWRPDVASDLHTTAVRDLPIVFQQEGGTTFYNSTTSGIYGVVITLGGSASNGTAGTPFVIDDGVFEDAERPNVGKVMDGGPQEWTVAYQVIGNNGLFSPHVDWDVELRRFDRFGNVSAATVIGLANGEHEMAPRVAGFNAEQLLAFTCANPAVVGARPAAENGMRIITQRFDWDGAAFAEQYASDQHFVHGDARAVLTGVDLDTNTMSHYAMLFRSSVTDHVYLHALGYRGHLVTATTVFSADPGDTTTSGGVAFDDDGDRFLVAYGLDDNSLGTHFTNVDVYVHPAQNPPLLTGLSCSTAQLSWEGSTLIGDEDCKIRLDNLAPGALATIIVGTQPYQALLTGVPLVHPGCWLLVPNTGAGSLATMPIAFGPSVSYDIDLPEWLPPMSFYFQGVHFNAGNTEVFTTERLSVTVVK